MTMHTLCFQEHERSVVQNSNGQLPSVTIPWWGGLGSQSAYGQSYSKLKHPSCVEHGSISKQTELGTEPGLEEGFAKFTIFPGCGKNSGNDTKNPHDQATITMQTTTPMEQGGYFSLGVPQTMICGKYPYGDHQYYGLFSSYGPQFQGRIMLPLDHNNDDGPVYVNAKQYHGIIRRRLSRAKALSRQKAPKIRKPFMHLSRHLHAMRRPRGCGGRFMNTKTMETGKETTKQIQKISANGVISHTTDSQSSEVLQSDCGSTKMSFLEVTSDPYPPFMFNHIRPIVHDFSGMLSAVGHGVVMPSKWVAATDRRCNLNA